MTSIWPFIFFLFHTNLPSVVNVVTLLLIDNVRIVTPQSQRGSWQSCRYNVWKKIKRHLINPTKCNYIAIEWAPPFQLYFGVLTLEDFMHVANVVKGMQLSPTAITPTHCREVVSKKDV